MSNSHRHRWLSAALGAACLANLLLVGCVAMKESSSLPTRHVAERGQLVVYTNSPLSTDERLLSELEAQRVDISEKLQLTIPAEPIRIYLFDSSARYHEFLQLHYPDLPQRRAYFMQADARLAVYSHRNELLAEDLRHEVTHGYLHAAMARIPIWLDEGLAEYFEVGAGRNGMNWPHARLLLTQLANGRWRPNLPRLEQLATLHEMSQLDYAESWAWIHWLLESSPATRQLLINHLQDLRSGTAQVPLSAALWHLNSTADNELMNHLIELQARSETIR